MNVETRKERRRKNLLTIEDLTEDQKTHFCKMVDECILECDGDREMNEGFAYLDEMALKTGKTFYDVILQLYEMSEITRQIDKWKEEKGFK